MLNNILTILGGVAIIVLVMRHIKTWKSHRGVHSTLEVVWHIMVWLFVAYIVIGTFVYYAMVFAKAWNVR